MTTNSWSLINPQDFLAQASHSLIVDVRSQAEFEEGHIPNAINIPLLNNEERIIVGTLYKQRGKEVAYQEALKLIGPKMFLLIESVEAELEKRALKNRNVLIYCWRGGLRSQSVYFLFKSYGLKCCCLLGGYKNYRRFIRGELQKKVNILLIGGYTGSGKSEILNHLISKGEQVLDLERLAHHKGSAFGNLGELPPPTNEQFENNIYQVWSSFDLQKRIFIEDESRNIGKIQIPDPLFEQMRNSPVLFLEVSKEQRSYYLAKIYGQYPQEGLLNCLKKIEKKMGGQNCQQAITFILQNQYQKAAELILHYYDKTYSYGVSKRNPTLVHKFPLLSQDQELNATLVLNSLEK